MNNNFYTKSELSKRWSLTLIEKYFPKCSKVKVNPHYKCASPMQLYDISKVKMIESTDDFKADYEKTAKRKEAALERGRKRREKLVMYANGIQICIPTFDKKRLTKEACEHYNCRNASMGRYDRYASLLSDEEFLKRITINYLRHQCTVYENELDKFYGKVGKHDAHDVLKERINEAIRQKYEWLR